MPPVWCCAKVACFLFAGSEVASPEENMNLLKSQDASLSEEEFWAHRVAAPEFGAPYPGSIH